MGSVVLSDIGQGFGEKWNCGRDEIERCVKELMDSGGVKMKKNATKWREVVAKAVGEGGSSLRNIDNFVAKVITHKKMFEIGMLDI
ncbi:Flavonol 7-O-beta-glucosyltransferase UGT74F1 [Linum grandiflorum]